jgi:endonuclease YncB( thermonuclease family)
MTKREQGMYGRWAAAGLCVLLVGLAGCVGVPAGTRAAVALGAELTPVSVTVAPTATLVSSPTAIVVPPSATPAPSPKPAPTEPAAAATVALAPTDARFTEAQVIQVVDGDTIKVLVAGEKFTLRYIGIDTPEMSAADGKAAREQNVALVGGRSVRLEQDVSATDPYGRLLRYVWVGDMMVNAELVRLGYARAVAYPPDTGYQAPFAGLQAEAQAARRGLWAKAAQTPVAGHELVQITGMQRDGAISPNEPDEWVEITNQGTVAEDLTGWHLDSERGAASGQVFHFSSGLIMQPGQVCRVYTDEVHPEWCGLSFGYRKSGVWSNSEPDAAVLFDGGEAVVSRRE